MAKTVQIEYWAVVSDNPKDVHIAPERRKRHLTGEVYGHPSFKDGDVISTGTLVSSSERTASTKETTYVLGEPHPDYIAFLAAQDPPEKIDPEEPIKFRTE